MLATGIILLVLLWAVGLATVEKYPLFFVGVLVTAGSFIFLIIGIDDGSYREGQIDAINGIIKYELQEQENASMKWVEVEE